MFWQNYSIKSRDIFETDPKLRWNVADDRIVFVDEREGGLVHLEGIGSDIWRAFDGKKNVDQIVKDLQLSYDAPSGVIKNDAERFIKRLFEMEYIQRVKPD